MKILVVSPHRDDAAFSLGLAIGTWLEGGHKVHVVNCFTRSEFAPYSEVDHLHPNDRMPRISAIRSREDQAWLRLYGPGLSLSDLNLKDAPLRRHTPLENVCSIPVDPADKAILKVGKAIERETPGVLLLPLGLGSHVDHLTVRDALLPASHTDLPVAFYEDLPDAAKPIVADTIATVAESLHGDLLPAFAAAPSDSRAATDRKRRLALCYDSQVDTEVTEEIAGFCERYEGRERLWANPAWRASALCCL